MGRLGRRAKARSGWGHQVAAIVLLGLGGGWGLPPATAQLLPSNHSSGNYSSSLGSSGGISSAWGSNASSSVPLSSGNFSSSIASSSTGPVGPANATQAEPYAGAFALACWVSFFNLLPQLISHSDCIPAGLPRMAMQRHESLIGEHLAVRGPLHFLGFAYGAVPQGPSAQWNQTTADWATAGLVGSNVRLLWESAESLYVFAGRPGHEAYGPIRDWLIGPQRDGASGFILNRIVVPLERRFEALPATATFHRAVGWGIGNDGAYAIPAGLSIAEGHAWFQWRFHFTALMGEAYRAYRTGSDYTVDDAVGAITNIYWTPQVGALGVSMTQLIPIIGAINKVAHGTAGPGWTRYLSRRGGPPARLGIYLAATSLYTWPQYDIVFTMMANVPGGAGGVSGSGLVGCIREFGRPCVAGPTATLYTQLDGSGWAFAPLGVALVVQAMTLRWLWPVVAQAMAPHADLPGAADLEIPVFIHGAIPPR